MIESRAGLETPGSDGAAPILIAAGTEEPGKNITTQDNHGEKSNTKPDEASRDGAAQEALPGCPMSDLLREDMFRRWTDIEPKNPALEEIKRKYSEDYEEIGTLDCM